MGLTQAAVELGLSGTNLWIYPDADRNGNLARYLRDPDTPFLWLFISCPSAKDPSFQTRSPGRATLEIIAPAATNWFAPWLATRWQRRGDAYATIRARFTGRLLAGLYCQLPQVRGQVDQVELSTSPLYPTLLRASAGGDLRPERYPPRFRLRLRAQSPVPGLFLTGQDLVTAGVVGVLAASAVPRRNVLRDILKGA